MDPNGGVSPSNPRLDNTAPQPGQPMVNQPQTGGPTPVTAPTLETPSLGISAPVQLPDNNLGSQPITVPTGAMPPAANNGTVLKKILVGLGAVILIAVLAGGGYFVGFAAGKSKGRVEADAEYQRRQAQAQQEAAENEEAEENTAELQLGDLKDPKYVDETVEGEVGEQLSASDGFVLKVVNVERNFQSTDTNYRLDSSKELIKVNFLIGNIAKDKAKDIGNFNFRLEDSANAQLVPENIAEYADKFDTVKLEPGGQAKGSIIYAVNKDEKPLKFVREQRYRISGENREVTIRIVVTVAQ